MIKKLLYNLIQEVVILSYGNTLKKSAEFTLVLT